MNDEFLERRLREAPVPERDEAYWREFPERVSRRIAAETVANLRSRPERAAERCGWRLRWGPGWPSVALAAAAVLAVAGVVVGLLMKGPDRGGLLALPGKSVGGGSRGAAPGHPSGHASGVPANDDAQELLRGIYQQVADLFPGRLEAIVLGPDGPRLQLSEAADVPASPPVVVRVCGPAQRCETAVSFSGQTVRLGEREVEVLASGGGDVFVVARDGVWGAEGGAVGDGDSGPWRFEAGWLEGGPSGRRL